MAGVVAFHRLALCVLVLLSLEVKGLEHGGSHFYVTFLPFVTPNGEVERLFITTPERVPVNFTISAPGTGYFRRATVDPGGVKEFTFDGRDYALRNTTDRSKGIIITAENERQIFVYGAQYVAYSTASFLALPPHDLWTASYTYIAAMYHTTGSGGSGGTKDIHAQVAIVSSEDYTHLTITPTKNVNIGTESVQAGESIDVTLHRAETLLIQCVGDLTGTKVTSWKPISFFCGDQCPKIPYNIGGCDQIVEQLPPVEAWGRKFVTAPLKTRRSYDMFRIVAAWDGTTVTIRCRLRNGNQGYTDTFHLNESGFANVKVGSSNFCWIEADKSILLLQFAVGQSVDDVSSDPFMALVPAVSQYTNSLTLPNVKPRSNGFAHYLNIIIPAEHYQPDQIFLDGQSLQSRAFQFVAIVQNGETMAYAAQVTVSATTHTLIHGNSTGCLGVVSYGFEHGVSYGHVGGIRLSHRSTCNPPVCPTCPPPPSPLTELTVLEITSTSFTISLRPLHRDVENGNTIHCLINVTNMDRRNVVLHDNVNCASPEFRVPELSADCVYQVAVTAVLGERVGPSMTLFVKTSPYVEGHPTSPASIPTSTSTPSSTAAIDDNSIFLTIILGSVIGFLLIILIVAVISGICICICLHMCSNSSNSSSSSSSSPYKKQDDTEMAIYDTIPGDSVKMEDNPAYDSLPRYQRPKSKLPQK